MEVAITPRLPDTQTESESYFLLPMLFFLPGHSSQLAQTMTDKGERSPSARAWQTRGRSPSVRDLFGLIVWNGWGEKQHRQ